MTILKIIFYGLLAMLERRPIFTIGLLALLILPPIYFEWVRWFYLGLLIFILLIVFAIKRKIRKLRQQFEQQYRDAMGGNGGAGFAGFGGFGGTNGAGFSGFNFSQGMTLEELVRQMQQQADARNAQSQQGKTTIKDNSSKLNSGKNKDNNEGEYVDFEEIK